MPGFTGPFPPPLWIREVYSIVRWDASTGIKGVSNGIARRLAARLRQAAGDRLPLGHPLPEVAEDGAQAEAV